MKLISQLRFLKFACLFSILFQLFSVLFYAWPTKTEYTWLSDSVSLMLFCLQYAVLVCATCVCMFLTMKMEKLKYMFHVTSMRLWFLVNTAVLLTLLLITAELFFLKFEGLLVHVLAMVTACLFCIECFLLFVQCCYYCEKKTREKGAAKEELIPLNAKQSFRKRELPELPEEGPYAVVEITEEVYDTPRHTPPSSMSSDVFVSATYIQFTTGHCVRLTKTGVAVPICRGEGEDEMRFCCSELTVHQDGSLTKFVRGFNPETQDI
ncbi:ORF18 [White sturgeon adenovirus 1]|uniref:ORF18 n=1 Tax=White sturgeon adenovirus 1 TaxID=2580388 RepID=A0A4P8PIV3_9ADEN|nr:ORF18 [White sturgeon adenovirus 1]QCQ84179.1 ORF18 [White sturgeon adenovirus 1]